MVLNILTSPDAIDSIQLGVAPLVVFILSILALIAFEIYLIKKITHIGSNRKSALNKKLNKFIITPLFLIILSEKVTYGLASLFNKNEIVSKFKVIPLYQPLTFNRMAKKYFGYLAKTEVKNTIATNADLNYPINPLKLKDNPNRFNIFIIASDSVPNSFINKEITPNIENFKKDALVFNQHYSGGDATRFGIFSLIYGLNSTYWFSFLNAQRGSVLFDVLKKLDYQIDIISSTNTNWPEFRKTCYVNIQKSIKDDFNGLPYQKDRESTNYFLKRVEEYNKKNPIFSFIFLDSPHGYSAPKSYNPFHAKDEEINYITMSKDSPQLDNLKRIYKNAVSYNDKLFKEMIDKLKEQKLYDNSLIIYTSDHGQEFYEYGNFGHNSSFSKAQTNTPMIIKLPNFMKNSIELDDNYTNKLSSHSDIVPTLLTLIGVKNPPSDYSNGYNLFSKNFHRDYVFSANWNNNAIITKKLSYIFSNMPNKMFKNEIRKSSDYRKVENVKVDSKKVLSVINENRRFLK
ncbi:Predicted hydrolase [hydrothermal vent metagenome]|uniref:Predicted hydrolase n=1 Tax=hydrothermal vent metagenome TaxID=652676 RepID=A0A1W1CL82_9ZZZZ